MDARRRIREWLKAALAGDGPHDMVAVQSACAKELRRDPEFVAAFLDEYLVYIVGQVAGGMAHDVPRYRHNVGARVLTTEQLREEIAQEAESESASWARWITTDRGAPVPLLEMTKIDLLRAVDEKKRKGDVAYKDAAFFRAIADTLNDNEAVGDVWKAKDLEDLYGRISLRIKADVVLIPALTEGVAD